MLILIMKDMEKVRIKIKYDDNDNPLSTRISKKVSEELVDGLYEIRNKGTDRYLKLEKKKVFVKEDLCSQTKWILEKINDDYIIRCSINTDYSLTYSYNEVWLSNDNVNNLFSLEKNKNGSYLIKVKDEDKYLKISGDRLVAGEFVYGDTDFEFYFEVADREFIESSATYSEDGRFVASVTDSNFNTTEYENDSVTGLLTSMTNAKGIVTEYEYNDKKQLESVTIENITVNYDYDNRNLLTKIISGNKEYNFDYDGFLKLSRVSIGEEIVLVDNEYEANNGNLIETNYGNGHTVTFDYDEFDRVKTVNKMNDEYHYKYDNNGNIAKVLSNDYVIKYSYDIGKRMHEYRFNNFKINYEYDSNNNVVSKKYKLGNHSNIVENIFNKDDLVTKTRHGNNEINCQYDDIGRIISRNINESYNAIYKYVTNGKRTTELVKSITNGENTYSYDYDKLNNITHIYCNDELIKQYFYDDYNELIEEIDYEINERIEYSYDTKGNILLKKRYERDTKNLIDQKVYEYGNIEWEDQLTRYDNKAITYDDIGNPLTYDGNTYTWINGRQLQQIEKGNNIYQYNYDENGIRIEKNINGIVTKYFLEGSSIIYEQRGNDTIYYNYDSQGVSGFEYQNNTYYFVKSLQGDIIEILNDSYQTVAKYEYTSFGEILSIKDGNGTDVSNNSSHIANINSFRYRSYYYDTETGMYYLNSRYYNPEMSRFLNVDIGIANIGEIQGYNMYQYAFNNPINFDDSNGSWPKWIKKAVAAVAVVVAVVVVAVAVTAIAGAGTVAS